MMNKVITLIPVWVILLILISCSKGETEAPQPIDEYAPTMTISSPTDGASMPKGAFLILDAVFEDDIALKELKVSLTAPRDLKTLKGIKEPWSPVDEVIMLTGTKHIIEAHNLFNEEVPADCLSGTYKLNFELIDAKGKVATKAIDVVVF